MEPQTSVSIPCDSEEESERYIENEGMRLDHEAAGTEAENVAPPHVRQVYLITYSQANIEKFPTRRVFAECVAEAFGQTGAGVKHWVCCRERHTNEGQHYHMTVKLERIRRWAAVKNYLKHKHEITVHFSNVHDNYYSAWKYVTKEDEEVLQSSDHPYLWNSKPPRTHRASERGLRRST